MSQASGHPPALGQEAGEPFSLHVPSPGQGSEGEPHKVDPPDGGDLLAPQESVYPVLCLARWEGGAEHRCCPIEVGRGGPQDPLRVLVGHDGEEERGTSQTPLPERLPPVVGVPCPGEGQDRCRWAQLRGAG